VKLVEASQLLGRKSLFLRAEGRERRPQPLGQSGRAIVVAHVIKDIGHCNAPLWHRVLVAEIRPLGARDYPR
jgi:hypothetical protein